MRSRAEVDLDRELTRLRELLLSRPEPGSAGLTGTWRFRKPVLDESRCTRCGLCWLYCPDEVIEWVPGEVPRVDYRYCKGCGICAVVCPRGAISMELESE